MKKICCFLLITLAVGVFAAACKSSQGVTDKEKMEIIAGQVDSMNYRFVPQSAIPMRGGAINLTPTYWLTVSKDTVEAYLPYFGRAYTAPIDPTDGGIKFISTDFVYNISEKKKGVWNVDIEINDSRMKPKLSLTIGETGYTTLFVSDTNRQPITFYGQIDR